MRIRSWIRQHKLATAVAGSIGFGVIAGFAWAQGTQIITTLTGAELFDVQTGPLLVQISASNLSTAIATLNPSPALSNPTIKAGTGTGTFQPMGRITGFLGTAATTGTTVEQTLATYSLPANSLNTSGRRLRATAFFSKAANSNNITPAIYFGDLKFGSGSAYTTNIVSNTVVFQMNVVQTGTTNQQVAWNVAQIGTQVIAPTQFNASGTAVQSGAITIKATCQNGTSSAGDCVLQDFFVEFMD